MVTATYGLVHSPHHLVNVFLYEWPIIRRKRDNGNLPALQALLVFQIAITGNKNLEAVQLHLRKKIAVF